MIPLPPTPARREESQPERLTVVEFFLLFGRSADDTRWIGTADSQEYLAVVTYLVDRSSHEH